MISQDIKVSKLPESKQKSIYAEILKYARELGYSERECKEMAEHAMTLTLFELSECIYIKKYM